MPTIIVSLQNLPLRFFFLGIYWAFAISRFRV